MKERISLPEAILIIVCLAFFVAFFFGYLGLNLHLPLLFHMMLTSFLGWTWGFSWRELEEMLMQGIGRVSLIVMILLLIGGLIGLWIVGGTIPTIIVFGLETIKPPLFYLMAFWFGSLTSFAMGTGIGTLSTVGLAFFSIGMGMGLPLPSTAGAVISGAYFGDRFSPLSSILIFTAFTTEVDISTTLKSMLITTIPVFIISSLFFLFLGTDVPESAMSNTGTELITFLEINFNIVWWTVLPPVFIIILSLLRIPTIVTLAMGLVFSFILLWFLNPSQGLHLLTSIYSGPSPFETQNPVIRSLFARGGIVSMLDLIALIMMAGALSGLLEKMGVFEVLLWGMIKRARTTRHLFMGAGISSILVAMVGCNQLLAVLMPGRAFLPYFQGEEERAILARVLTDTGLVSSPLIPWNINALLVYGVLGVHSLQYFFYSIPNWSFPVLTFIVLFSMGTCRRLEELKGES